MRPNNPRPTKGQIRRLNKALCCLKNKVEDNFLIFDFLDSTSPYEESITAPDDLTLESFEILSGVTSSVTVIVNDFPYTLGKPIKKASRIKVTSSESIVVKFKVTYL